MQPPPVTDQTAPFVIYALFALNGLGWGITFLFIKSWMNDVRTGIKDIRDSVDTKQSNDGCSAMMDKLEAQISRDNTKNCGEHSNIWERVNSHAHEAKCAKLGEVCTVEVGRVLIGIGGKK